MESSDTEKGNKWKAFTKFLEKQNSCFEEKKLIPDYKKVGKVYDASKEWWTDLDKTKGGRVKKILMSSVLVGSVVLVGTYFVAGGAAVGGAGAIATKLGMRTGISMVSNMVATSDWFKQLQEKEKRDEQTGSLKKEILNTSNYISAGGLLLSLGMSVASGNFKTFGVGGGTTVINKALNAWLDRKIKSAEGEKKNTRLLKGTKAILNKVIVIGSGVATAAVTTHAQAQEAASHQDIENNDTSNAQALKEPELPTVEAKTTVDVQIATHPADTSLDQQNEPHTELSQEEKNILAEEDKMRTELHETLEERVKGQGASTVPTTPAHAEQAAQVSGAAVKIESGDGISQAVKRFLDANEKVAEKLGYNDDIKNADAHEQALFFRKLMQETGVIDQNGHEYGLTTDAVGKELEVKFDANNNPVIEMRDHDTGNVLATHSGRPDSHHTENKFEHDRGERHYGTDGKEITQPTAEKRDYGDMGIRHHPEEQNPYHVGPKEGHMGMHYHEGERMEEQNPYHIGPEEGNIGMHYHPEDHEPVKLTQADREARILDARNLSEEDKRFLSEESEKHKDMLRPEHESSLPVQIDVDRVEDNILEKLKYRILNDEKLPGDGNSRAFDLRRLWEGDTSGGMQRVSAEDIMEAKHGGSPASDKIYDLLKEFKDTTDFREPKGAGFFREAESAENYLKKMLEFGAKNGFWEDIKRIIKGI